MEINETVHKIRIMLWDTTYTRYINQELFSFQWWIIIFFLICLYALWWKLVDKSRLRDILLFGSFVAVMVAFVDVAGATRGLWQYNIRLLPVLPALFPYDYTAIPILFMLVYQHTNSWSLYVVRIVITAAIFSFILQPIFVTLGVIQLFEWQNGFSFGILVIVGLTARYVMQMVTMCEMSSKTRTAQRASSSRPVLAKPLSLLDDDKADGE